MPTGFVDPEDVHTPAPGVEPPVAWGLVVNHDLRFLAGPPAASVSGAVQAVAAGADTALEADTVRYDDAAAPLFDHDQPSVLTVTQPGLYSVFTALTVEQFSADNGDRLVLDFLAIDQAVPADVRLLLPAPQVTRLTVPRMLLLAEGDAVSVQVNHNAGGAANVTLEEFSLTWMRRTP